MELPTRAKSKLDRLVDAENEAFDLLNATQRRLSDLNRALGTAPSDVTPEIEAEIARLSARRDELGARHRARADLNSALRLWLNQTRSPLEDARPVKAAPRTGETISDAVLRLRQRHAVLTQERIKVMRASIPKEDLKNAVSQYVKSLSQRGAPRISAEHGKSLEVIFSANDTWSDQGITKKLPAVLAWFDPATLEARLIAAVDAAPDAFALSAAERQEMLAGIEAELLQGEMEEEALIALSEAAEAPIMRRINADARAVLGVQLAGTKSSKPQRVRAA
ncbi:hypothetical protein [Bradyrhizobium sp. USDA 336]|uniref:hypothetical protein n=1 Tax=Bradyrhizobium sp. USDA 336 TaxID=3156311 RepID=UPI003835667D